MLPVTDIFVDVVSLVDVLYDCNWSRWQQIYKSGHKRQHRPVLVIVVYGVQCYTVALQLLYDFVTLVKLKL